MSGIDFLAILARRGVRVTAEGETLRIDAPTGALAPWELDLIRKYKADILDELTVDRPDDLEHEEPVECPRCGGIDCWWNGLGQRRCMACAPPSKVAQRYLETLVRMRTEGKCRAAGSDSRARGRRSNP